MKKGKAKSMFGKVEQATPITECPHGVPTVSPGDTALVRHCDECEYEEFELMNAEAEMEKTASIPDPDRYCTTCSCVVGDNAGDPSDFEPTFCSKCGDPFCSSCWDPHREDSECYKEETHGQAKETET